MPIDSLDNSLALGFYCRDHGEIIVPQTVATSSLKALDSLKFHLVHLRFGAELEVVTAGRYFSVV
jgi:hypothetical protein